MTKIATSGMASCATFSLEWFKGKAELNEEYIKAKKGNPAEAIKIYEACRNDIGDWFDNILYPIEQELGELDKHHPFEAIMEVVSNEEVGGNEGTLDGKMIFALLNQTTLQQNDYYWLDQLLRWDFELVDATNNDIGMECFLFIRNKNRIVPFKVGLSTKKGIMKYV